MKYFKDNREIYDSETDFNNWSKIYNAIKNLKSEEIAEYILGNIDTQDFFDWLVEKGELTNDK